jgi:membrane-associated protein
MANGFKSLRHWEALSYQASVTQTLQHFLGSLGVWSIFWFSAIGPYVFPAAGEIAILLGAATRAYPMPAIVILATAGGVVSDHAAYWFGRRAGSHLVARFLQPDRRLVFERRIQQHAPLWLVLGRLVTAVRTYLAIAAGIGKFDYGRFTLYNLVGCVLWAIAFTALGYFLGAHIDARSLVTALERYSLAIIGVVVAIYVGLFLLRRFRTRKLP